MIAIRGAVRPLLFSLSMAALGSAARAQGARAEGRQPPFEFAGPGQGMAAQILNRNPLGLLMRPEVQNALELDVRQKNLLAEMQLQQRNAMVNAMRLRMQDMRNLPPDQRAARMRDMANEMRAQRETISGELTEKLKEVLTEKQIERLDELDLQYRGILALGDPRTAQRVGISREHQAQIYRIAQEFQSKVSDEARSESEKQREAMQAAANRQGGNRLPNPQVIMQAVQRKIATLKREYEMKADAVLSAQEKAAWESALGKPFTFRNLPSPSGGTRPG